jgi:hypothetical protein
MTCGCEGRTAVPAIAARLRCNARRGRDAFSKTCDDRPPLAHVDSFSAVSPAPMDCTGAHTSDPGLVHECKSAFSRSTLPGKSQVDAGLEPASTYGPFIPAASGRLYSERCSERRWPSHRLNPTDEIGERPLRASTHRSRVMGATQTSNLNVYERLFVSDLPSNFTTMTWFCTPLR